MIVDKFYPTSIATLSEHNLYIYLLYLTSCTNAGTKNISMKKAANIDEYIADFPAEVQEILETVRATIQKAAPEATEAIKYAIPTFILNGNLVHFAGFKNHIGLYPAPSGIEAFEKEVAPYHTGKGTLQFPLDKPIPLKLISKIVKYRVEESKKKAVKKKG